MGYTQLLKQHIKLKVIYWPGYIARTHGWPSRPSLSKVQAAGQQTAINFNSNWVSDEIPSGGSTDKF